MRASAATSFYNKLRTASHRQAMGSSQTRKAGCSSDYRARQDYHIVEKQRVID